MAEMAAENEIPVVPVLSDTQILEAATNTPELSPDEVKFGDKIYKLVYLPYDDYILFLGLLQPIFEALSAKSKVKLPGIDIGSALNANSILKFCAHSLPEMTQIALRQTESTITIAEIKETARSPFALVNVVLAQVKKNNVIADFVSFFAQVAPLLNLTPAK